MRDETPNPDFNYILPPEQPKPDGVVTPDVQAVFKAVADAFTALGDENWTPERLGMFIELYDNLYTMLHDLRVPRNAFAETNAKLEATAEACKTLCPNCETEALSEKQPDGVYAHTKGEIRVPCMAVPLRVMMDWEEEKSD